MIGIRGMAWRVVVVALGYALTTLVAGRLLSRSGGVGGLVLAGLSGLLIAVTLCLTAARIQASRLRHFVVWGSVLLFNAVALGIEGSFFAPSQSPVLTMPLPWTAFLLFQTFVTAVLIALLFASDTRAAVAPPTRERMWYSWAWRFVVSALSYLVFYFIFGAVNYALVTGPYYQAHVSGLAVPTVLTLLMAEMVRAPLIVLSIVPLILTWTAGRRLLAVLSGLILFVVGGVVPLLSNTALPDFLRLASAVEIFFQNFLAGVVAAALLGFGARKA